MTIPNHGSLVFIIPVFVLACSGEPIAKPAQMRTTQESALVDAASSPDGPTATTVASAGTPGAPQPAAAAAEPGAAAGPMPDLTLGLETGSCGKGPGNEGADSHFIGNFSIDGDQVVGTERWLLHANAKLQASKLWGAGTDCEVRWLMVGTTTSPQHCGDCDLGLQLKASVDKTGSTCPEDMVDREDSFSVRYDVRRGSDGVAYVYFASTGNLLGQGYHQGGLLSYLSQHQCKWF